MADRPSLQPLAVGAVAVVTALLVGTLIGIGPAWWLSNQEAPPVDPFRDPTSRDLGDDATLEITEQPGGFDIELDAPAAPTQRVILVEPDGDRQELAAGTTSAEWDSTGAEEGMYRIQVEEETPDGLVIIAEETFELREPGEPGTVAFAAAIGAFFSMAGSILGSVLAGQSAIVVQVAQESLIGLGESRMKDAEEKRRVGRAAALTNVQVRRAVIIAVVAAVVLMAVFFTFEEMDETAWGAFIAKLPLVAPIAGAFALLAFGAEWLLALATGTVARFKLLISGAVTLALSAILLRTAFGFPGYIDEDVAEDEELAPHVEGWRGIAAMAAFPAALIPFVVIGWWHYEVVGVAMNVGLAGLAAVAMPFKPMPGNDVWRWNRFASFGMWAGALTLFFGFEVGFMSLLDFFITGLVCLAVLLTVASWLFIRRQEPGWYKQLLAQLAEAARREPAWIKAPRQGAVRAARAADRALMAGIARAGDAARTVAARAVQSRETRAARKGTRIAMEAFDAAGPDVDTLTIADDRGRSHTLHRADVEAAHLALEVAQLFRKLPSDVVAVTAVNPETGEGQVFPRA